jgi:DNA repair protein RadC
MSDNIHEGHRARLKEKYRTHGMDSFTDVEALELLLFYAVPRADTNALAHALLKRFRDFRGVMEAGLDELREVPGIGENAASLLRLVTDLNIRYQRSASTRGTKISGSRDAGAFLIPQFQYRTGECGVLLCMDTANRVIGCHVLGEGTSGMVDVGARDVVETVLRDKAARVILAHNHLSGIALPSSDDVETTRRLFDMLRMIGVELVDHIIVSDGDFVSMRDSGHFDIF